MTEFHLISSKVKLSKDLLRDLRGRLNPNSQAIITGLREERGKFSEFFFLQVENLAGIGDGKGKKIGHLSGRLNKEVVDVESKAFF